jgi:regulator of sirC expression with transglutaminase-like and TPR domain
VSASFSPCFNWVFLLACLVTPFWPRIEKGLAIDKDLDPVTFPEIQSPKEIDWSRNIAFIALDIETQLHEDYILSDLDRGFVTMQDNRDVLGRILHKAEKRIPIRKDYGEEEAMAVAVLMHEILEEEGFTYRSYSSDAYRFLGANVFGYGLAKREIDCVSYCILGLAIAEHRKLPLVGIYMPGHCALRWILKDGSHLNLELSIPASCRDDFYILWKKISMASLTRGIYLRSLSKQEVIAQQYYNLGLVWEKREQFQKAMSALNKARSLMRDFPDAYNLRGILYKSRGQFKKALNDFDRALVLDQRFFEARINRANVLKQMGEY